MENLAKIRIRIEKFFRYYSYNSHNKIEYHFHGPINILNHDTTEKYQMELKNKVNQS